MPPLAPADRSQSFSTFLWFGAIAWILVVAVAVGQLALGGALDWSLASRLALREWMPWAVLAPLVAWWAVRFPFERRVWPVSAAIHLLGCAAVVALCAAFLSWTASPLPTYRGRMQRLSDHRHSHGNFAPPRRR